MTEKITGSCPSSAFKSAYGKARDIDRSDITIDEILGTWYGNDPVKEEKKKIAFRERKRNSNLTLLRHRNQHCYNKIAEELPGYVLVSALPDYHKQRAKRQPDVYQLIIYKKIAFIPEAVANNLPEPLKRGGNRMKRIAA